MDENSLDRSLTDVIKILGPYAERATIGGGIALLLYRHYIASKENFPIAAGTKDLDLIVPRRIDGAELLSTRLEHAGFKRLTHSMETPPVESYVGTVNGNEIVLEFLTDQRSRESRDKNVDVAGVSAQPLSYIEMSQVNRMPFTTRDRAKGYVVKPAAWIFHKLLTFSKRGRKEKLYKDVYGIWYVGSQLGEFSQGALKDLTMLAATNAPSWKRRAGRQIRDWVASARPADWDGLIAQDPSGTLTQIDFVDLVRDKLSV